MAQTSQIVAHPETGKPVKEVTTVDFQDVERNVLEEDVTNAQNIVNDKTAAKEAKQAELDVVTKELAEAEAHLQDCKSNVESYDKLAAEQPPAPGAEASGGENADANAEGAVSVPVVNKDEEPQFG